MNPFVALCVWSFMVMLLGFVAGYLSARPPKTLTKFNDGFDGTQQKLWAAVMAAGGKISIPERTILLNHPREFKLVEYRDPASWDYVMRLVKDKSSDKHEKV